MPGARALLLAALLGGLVPSSPWAEEKAKEASGREASPDELAAYALARESKFVKAREQAEGIVRQNPGSFVAHFVLGLVHHYGEGNLPRSVWHFRQARSAFEQRYGKVPPGSAPWRWHAEILIELADVFGEMDLHAEKIEALDAHDRVYEPPLLAERAWPLMKLGRLAEAREAATKAAESGRPGQRKVALTALCAIASESRDRLAAYQACRKAADEVRPLPRDGGTELSNAGQAALGMLKLDEAERSFLESARRPVTAYGNPHARLAALYIREGRLPEAVGQIRLAHAHRRRKPAYLDQLSQAEMDGLAAEFFLALGRPIEALPFTERALDRPDRKGGSSGKMEETLAGTALVDRLARREVAERLAEEAPSWGFWEGLRGRAARLRLLAEAWASGRKAAILLGEKRRLLSTVRPSLSGGIDLSPWHAGELVGILGAGVVEQAVREARAEETLPAAASYLDALEAEAAMGLGDARRALALAERAIAGLQPAEALVRARAVGVAALAARRLGQREKELALLEEALQKDPPVIRRLGIALPVEIAQDGSLVAQEAARLIERSPRFRRGGGMRVVLSARSACLQTVSGAELVCALVAPEQNEDHRAVARRLVRDFHDRAFAPRVDLSQTDARSLDGSLGVGDTRASEKARSVLDELVGGGTGRAGRPRRTDEVVEP